MQPFSFIGSGTYTNPATIVTQSIALTDQPDWFFVKDVTNWGAQSTAANPIYSEWFSYMATGSYLALGQPSSTTTGVTTYASQGTSGGFTFIDARHPPTYAVLAATAINKTTMVVSMTSTAGLSVGDYVRVTNAVAMEQISGLVFQITALTANTSITLGYAASAVTAGLTFANNATSANIQKIIPTAYYPTAKIVGYITQATQGVVYFFGQNPYTVGELVDFYIPSTYGMTQLNGLTGLVGGAARVLAVTNSSTVSSITIQVNTSGYTAFQYPASSLNFASPAIVVPAGSGVVPISASNLNPVSPPGTNLVDAFDNRTQYIMSIGTSACGIASAVMVWFAFKGDFANGISNA